MNQHAIPVEKLGERIASLASQRDAIARALDELLMRLGVSNSAHLFTSLQQSLFQFFSRTEKLAT